jgi:hypothetical protein
VSLQRAHSAIPAGCAVRRRTRPGAHEAAEAPCPLPWSTRDIHGGTRGRTADEATRPITKGRDSGQPPRRMLRRRSPGSHPAASMQPHAATRRHTRRRLPLPSLCRPVRTGLSLYASGRYAILQTHFAAAAFPFSPLSRPATFSPLILAGRQAPRQPTLHRGRGFGLDPGAAPGAGDVLRNRAGRGRVGSV